MNEDQGFFTSFLCENCRTEIEASLDMIGETTECPACGTKFTVPDNRHNDGIARHEMGDFANTAAQALKSRTIRIELDDL